MATHHGDEDACMEDGCCRRATWFEADDAHWHDWIWCDEHARKRFPAEADEGVVAETFVPIVDAGCAGVNT